MLLGREAELAQLNHYYDRTGSQIVVVYGQKNIGKTALVKEFSRGKLSCYYLARSCSDREQVYFWGAELNDLGKKIEQYPPYTEIFRSISAGNTEKQVMIIDEFQCIIKTSPSFIKELVSFVRSRQEKGQVLVLLCSSSVGWVENSMIGKIGEAAYELSGLLKLKELKFSDITAFFPGFTRQQCVECYAVLGGIPGLWTHFSDKLSVSENIIQNILPPGSGIIGEAMNAVSEELRETAVYNTILASIAEGKHKLNDLYLHTGFSRAKISVYLKNLMELEIVEKVFSFDTGEKKQTQKGIYRIRDHFVYFYFRFLYPNLSSLAQQNSSRFYLRFIEPDLNSFVSEFFRDVCMEHLDALNSRDLLPVTYDRSGEWVGKAGCIDIVAQDENGQTLVAQCHYEKPLVTYEDYERLLYYMGKAQLHAEYIYLFSMDRFDEKLNLEAKVKNNLKLLSMKGV